MQLPSPRCASLFTALFLTFVCAGCGSTVSINGVDDIADELIVRGVQVESREPLPLPDGRHFRFDEGIALNGPELRVELIRIDDKKVYKIAVSAGVIIALGEHSAERRFPDRPNLYMSQPYMIVVRQEPAAGQVQSALQEFLTFDAAVN